LKAPVSSFVETGDHETLNYEGDITNLTRTLSVSPAESQNKFLERLYIVEQLELTASSHGMINRFVFPQDYLKVPFIKPKVAYYKYLRAKGIRFVINVNATSYHYGKMIVRWLPVVGTENLYSDTVVSRRYDQYTTTQAVYTAQGVDIELKGSSQTEFSVDYKLNNQYMRLDQLAINKEITVMGSLQLNVINPPLTIPEPRPVYVTIYAALIEPELSVPSSVEHDLSGMVTSTAPVSELFDTPLSTSVSPTYQMEEAEEKSKEGLISGKLEKVAAISDMLTPVPGVVGRAATVVSTAAKTGANVAKTLGYGKASDVSADSPMTMRVPSVSVGRGLLPTYKLTTDPENHKPSLGKDAMQDPSQMLIANIVKRESYLGTCLIPSTTTVGTRLMSIYLKPWLYRTGSKDLKGIPTNIYGHTLQSYVGSVFHQYRGGIRVRVEFIMSSFQSMRLWIVYLPPGETLPTTIEGMQSLQKRVITVNGTHSEEVVIPYVNSEYSILTETTDPLRKDIGSLHVVAASILTASTDNTQPIYLNTYFNCTDDAEFFIPRASSLLTDNYVIPEVQMGVVEEKTLLPFKANAVGESLTGERIDSIKTLMQRGVMLPYQAVVVGEERLQYSFNPASDVLFGIAGQDEIQRKDTVNEFTPLPWYVYFARMFRFRTGGLLVTLINNSDTGVTNITTIESAANWNTGTITSNPNVNNVWKAKQSQSVAGMQLVPGYSLFPASFKIPYYGSKPYATNNIILRNSEYLLSRPLTPSMFVRLNPGTESTTYVSAADDFELMDLLGAPTLYLQ